MWSKTAMTKKEFRIWLIKNDHTVTSLAKAVGLSTRTIENYNANDRYPKQFQLALKGLEK
jgi:DNA-binding XRE family transcriptional regulator